MLKESLKESNTVIISDAVSTYFHGQNDYQDRSTTAACIGPVGAPESPPHLQKNPEKKKTLSLEPKWDAGAAAAAAPVTPCDSPCRALLPTPSSRPRSSGPKASWGWGRGGEVVSVLKHVFRAPVNPSTHPRSKGEAPRKATCACKSGEINQTTAGTQN